MDGWITLTLLAERAGANGAGAPATSTLRRDIKAGLLRAELVGKTYLVNEVEAARWLADVWPKHLEGRDKPIGAKNKKTAKS